MRRLSLASRLVLNCVGCGFEPASVAIGDPEHPDETYGSRCWADRQRWNERPVHTHLDGCDCGRECES